MTMIDFNKPVQTRDGRKVRILCTDMKGGGDSVAGLINDDGEETTHSWLSDGSFISHKISDSTDLINVPETRVVWVNMYPLMRAEAFPTRMAANNNAGTEREACVRVECTVGQFDE